VVCEALYATERGRRRASHKRTGGKGTEKLLIHPSWFKDDRWIGYHSKGEAGKKKGAPYGREEQY